MDPWGGTNGALPGGSRGVVGPAGKGGSMKEGVGAGDIVAGMGRRRKATMIAAKAMLTWQGVRGGGEAGGGDERDSQYVVFYKP